MNSRINDEKEQVSDLADRIMEFIQSEQQTERQIKKQMKATHKICKII